MAGNYIDAPSDRLAWDRDGSALVLVSRTNTVTQLTATVRQTLNSEAAQAYRLESNMNFKQFTVLLPIPMDVYAYFISSGTNARWVVSTSKDSTTGVDGTWSGVATLEPSEIPNGVKPEYRTSPYVRSFPSTSESRGVRAVTFAGSAVSGSSSLTGDVFAIHLYGEPSANATTNRLALWHPTADSRLPATWFDWGNTPRSSSDDRSFRIKNLSDNLTAETLSVYLEALTPGTPSVAAMMSLSTDGGATFEGNKTIHELAPGAVTPPLILRRVVPSNATLSLWSARLAVDVSTWRS